MLGVISSQQTAQTFSLQPKSAQKGMSRPTQQHLDMLKRIGRYLRGHMRYTMRFAKQTGVYSVNAFSDNDCAGDKLTRTSTSGGMLCLGNHCVKAYSVNQSVIALPSGEAELYATNKAAAGALGMRSLLQDLGVQLQTKLLTDSSTSTSITTRRGLGNVRHIDTHELWLQEKNP